MSGTTWFLAGSLFGFVIGFLLGFMRDICWRCKRPAANTCDVCARDMSLYAVEQDRAHSRKEVEV